MKFRNDAIRSRLWPCRMLLPAALVSAGIGFTGCQNVPNIPIPRIPLPGTTSPSTADTTAAPRPTTIPATMPRDLAALYRKGTVTGVDLYDVLTTIRAELLQKRSMKSWTDASMLMDRGLSAAASGRFDITSILEKIGQAAGSAMIDSIKSQTLSISYKALDEHFTAMLGTQLRSALAAETIELPAAAAADPVQARRGVNMAAMVIAARLTRQILDQADKDFKALEVDYRSLLDQREKAATLLVAVVDKRQAATVGNDAAARRSAESDLRRSLSDEDLRFIDTELSSMSLTEFRQSLAAQNLALKYLVSADPKLVASYNVQRDDVVRRTTAYLRTTTGVAAFFGMSVGFLRGLSEIITERRLQTGIDSVPLTTEFARTMAPLVPRIGSLASQTIVFPSMNRARRAAFTATRGGETRELADSKAVFDAVQRSGAADQFSGALFRDNAFGWLNGVRRCDAAEAGRLLDAIVPQADRRAFADGYYGDRAREVAGEYAFVNAFTLPSLGERESRLPDELLGKNHRVRHGSAGGEHLARIQAQAAQQSSGWGDSHLMRLIFANADATAAYAMLDLDTVRIHPVPSPESVYVYESHVNACLARTSGRAPPAVPTSSPPSARPSATPSAPVPAASGPTRRRN